MASTDNKGRSRTAAKDADATKAMKPVDSATQDAPESTGGDAPNRGGARSVTERAQGAKDALAAKVSRRGTSRSTPREKARFEREDETINDGVRRVRLTLAAVDPFSVMKLSFLIALAIGISIVVAVAVLWNIIDTIGLWDQMDELGRSMNNNEPLPFMEYFEFSKFFGYGVIVAVLHVVILTALGTLLAFLYNIVARLLGGLRMTFTDE